LDGRTVSIQKLLIANRGEIAVRIIRACRELGIRTVAVYSEPDAEAMHHRLADESYLIGPAAATESYLDIGSMIEALEKSGTDSVHPGYGFLAENAEFARAVERAGATWVGPAPESMELMGSKVSAKRLARQAEVPTVPGYSEEASPERLAEEAERIGYPVLVKASAGGGGRGMRVVERSEDFLEAYESATREAEAAFGDGTVFLEKAVVDPRHVEVQVIADDYGNVIHLGERDCSIQRRHQKVVEEAPSPAITEELRRELGAAAVRLTKAAGYRNAGTVEFLLSGEEFYFLEMNTRLQVEHPVTELVTGLDLLHLQLAVAAGEPLPVTQDGVSVRGSAIEVRLYAEDPRTAMPSGGEMLLFEPPEGPGIRNDVGIESGDSVPLDYDPMLAKLIVHAPDRPSAVARMRNSLKEYLALGVTTNLPLLRQIADHEAFGAGETTTGFLEAHGLTIPSEPETPPEAPIAAAVGEMSGGMSGEGPASTDPFATGSVQPGGIHRLRYRLGDTEWDIRAERRSSRRWSLDLDGRQWEVEVVARRGGRLYLSINGRRIRCGVTLDGRDVLVGLEGHGYRLTKPRPLSLDDLGAGAGASQETSLTAPMPGTVIKVLVEEGVEVEAKQSILILEAMKMEQSIQAPYAGTVRKLPFEAGSRVSGGATLAEIEQSRDQNEQEEQEVNA
jgi:3-methylcrotonyl-CoA carboxylase alpha subunit